MSTTTTPGATSAATPGVSGPDADPAPDEGLRERKKRETRGRLHRVALELVVAHGLDHVTIEQIAGGADVSTPAATEIHKVVNRPQASGPAAHW